jgi:G3E family GTPase
VFLVNEFSAANVDSQLLPADAGPVVSLPGGSIFCRCLATEFIAQLRSLPERFHLPDAPLEGLIIEASGLADPRVVEETLRETWLIPAVC